MIFSKPRHIAKKTRRWDEDGDSYWSHGGKYKDSKIRFFDIKTGHYLGKLKFDQKKLPDVTNFYYDYSSNMFYIVKEEELISFTVKGVEKPSASKSGSKDVLQDSVDQLKAIVLAKND